jgi:four helix bundle protein
MQINSAKDLRVYAKAYELLMKIFELSKSFPPEERFALTSQIRRSSRSVCLNLREAWAKRRYEAHFISKLTDSDGENSETDSSLDFAALHKKAPPVSEPGAVATGHRENYGRRRTATHQTTNDLLNFQKLNFWPVATASGSDTATPTRLFTFCAKPSPKLNLICLRFIRLPEELAAGYQYTVALRLAA